jgi:cell wall-associated NlpC family hydrolase
MSPETCTRAAVVAEARRWLRTPYHHAAQVLGAGVDCAMLPAAVYRAAGLIPDVPVGHYPPDWHLHRQNGVEVAERYLEIVARHAREVPAPTGPGDFVLYRWGRAFAHGAIIVAWPRIIHAAIHVGVTEDDGDSGPLAGRERKFFTLWPSARPPHPNPLPAGARGHEPGLNLAPTGRGPKRSEGVRGPRISADADEHGATP